MNEMDNDTVISDNEMRFYEYRKSMVKKLKSVRREARRLEQWLDDVILCVDKADSYKEVEIFVDALVDYIKENYKEIKLRDN